MPLLGETGFDVRDITGSGTYDICPTNEGEEWQILSIAVTGTANLRMRENNTSNGPTFHTFAANERLFFTDPLIVAYDKSAASGSQVDYALRVTDTSTSTNTIDFQYVVVKVGDGKANRIRA